MLVSPTATTLNLQWTVPEMTNGDLLYYNYSCASTNRTEIHYLQGGVQPSLISTSLGELFPFSEYRCVVTASTSAGTSPDSNTATGVTAQSGISTA